MGKKLLFHARFFLASRMKTEWGELVDGARLLARAITPHRYAGMPVPAIPRFAYLLNRTRGCPDRMSSARLPQCEPVTL